MATTAPTTGERIVTLIKTIILARHGKAVKANPSDPDEARQLNQLGFEQAQKLGIKLKPYLFDQVVSSPLPRARMTMAIATCGRHVVHDIPALTCSTGQESPIEKMWGDLGNVPLTEYFKHPLGNELKVWANTALNAILNAIGGGSGKTVLVGGHALLQNALALTIATELHGHGIEDSTKASDMATAEILSEGEAFVLTLDRLSGQNRVITEHLRLD